MLTQTLPIFRLLARTYGYYPKEVLTVLPHDFLIDSYAEVLTQIDAALLTDLSGDPAEKAKRVDNLFNKALPSLLDHARPFLISDCKFLFGDGLTMADFCLGRIYTDCAANPMFPE